MEKGYRKNLPPLYVIAGKIKGRKIECPKGEIRPMTAKSRAALFNIIGNCAGMEMLDLFCGSGSISLEAFSRGAESSDLVDGDRGKKEIIEKNLQHAGFSGGKVFISDALLFCKRTTKQYDFIMVDPPYKMEKKEKIIETISENNLLKENGFVVIQLPKKYEISDKIGDLYRYDVRNYGLNALIFYSRKKTENENDSGS